MFVSFIFEPGEHIMYYIKVLSKKKNEAPYLGQWYVLEINRKIVYPLMKEMVINFLFLQKKEKKESSGSLEDSSYNILKFKTSARDYRHVSKSRPGARGHDFRIPSSFIILILMSSSQAHRLVHFWPSTGEESITTESFGLRT